MSSAIANKLINNHVIAKNVALLRLAPVTTLPAKTPAETHKYAVARPTTPENRKFANKYIKDIL